ERRRSGRSMARPRFGPEPGSEVADRVERHSRRIQRNPDTAQPLPWRRQPVPLRDLDYVIRKLGWMRGERIWPNGLRYLWTDAFGLVLYVSLFRETGEQHWLDAARDLVVDVDCVLGRERGYRIGEAADRDGQYFHYLAMWLYALAC